MKISIFHKTSINEALIWSIKCNYIGIQIFVIKVKGFLETSAKFHPNILFRVWDISLQTYVINKMLIKKLPDFEGLQFWYPSLKFHNSHISRELSTWSNRKKVDPKSIGDKDKKWEQLCWDNKMTNLNPNVA